MPAGRCQGSVDPPAGTTPLVKSRLSRVSIDYLHVDGLPAKARRRCVRYGILFNSILLPSIVATKAMLKVWRS